MTVDEVRTRIRRWLQEAIGVEGAEYLLDRPPGGWSDLATKRDVDALEARLDRRFGDVDRRFTELNAKFDEKFGSFDRKLGDLEKNLGLELDRAISDAFTNHLRWTIGTMTGLFAVFVAAIKF